MNSVMNAVMSMCPVTNSFLKIVMNPESHLLTTSGLVLEMPEEKIEVKGIFWTKIRTFRVY